MGSSPDGLMLTRNGWACNPLVLLIGCERF